MARCRGLITSKKLENYLSDCCFHRSLSPPLCVPRHNNAGEITSQQGEGHRDVRLCNPFFLLFMATYENLQCTLNMLPSDILLGIPCFPFSNHLHAK